jgi:DNA-binding MarR family transcriptional regulator
MPKPVQFTQVLRSWMDVAMQRSMRGWSHQARASGLSMPQFIILMQLYYRGNTGISSISERFGITAAAASQHVENLVQAGLIERCEAVEDRRVKQVQLSPKARSLLDKGMQARYAWVDELAECLEAKDQEKITEALAVMTAAASKLDQAA